MFDTTRHIDEMPGSTVKSYSATNLFIPSEAMTMENAKEFLPCPGPTAPLEFCAGLREECVGEDTPYKGCLCTTAQGELVPSSLCSATS